MPVKQCRTRFRRGPQARLDPGSHTNRTWPSSSTSLVAEVLKPYHIGQSQQGCLITTGRACGRRILRPYTWTILEKLKKQFFSASTGTASNDDKKEAGVWSTQSYASCLVPGDSKNRRLANNQANRSSRQYEAEYLKHGDLFTDLTV